MKKICALLLVLCLTLGPACRGVSDDEWITTTPLDFSETSYLDRSGMGWSWDGMSQTLILTDGLRLHTSGTAIALPAGATLQVRGEVEIVAGGESEEEQGAHGIVMGAGGTLAIGAGGKLNITASGDGIRASSLELETGTLHITSREGSCLRATSGDVSLGAGVSVQLAGEGCAITAERGAVTLSGSVELTAAGGGIQAGEGSGTRVTVASGADVTLRCEDSGAVGIDAGGDVLLAGRLDLTSGGAGLLAQGTVTGENTEVTIRAEREAGISAGKALTLTDSTLSIRQAGQTGVSAGEAVTLTSSTLAVDQAGQTGVSVGEAVTLTDSTLSIGQAGQTGVSAGETVTLAGSTLAVDQAGGDGLSAGGGVSLTASTLRVGTAEGYGVRAASDTLTIDPDSALSVTSAGEDGVSAAGLILVDGSLTVSQAAGQGLSSSDGGIRINGTVRVNAQGDGVSAQLGINCTETGLLNVEAGGTGLISQSGSITLLARPGEEASVTAGGDGVVSPDKVTVSRPGTWVIDAGGVGIRAQGDVTVGGAEEGACDLSIASGEQSIWSENGNVLMGPCDDLYFFDGTIHVNSDIGKTLSVLDGAGLLYGMRDGFAVGIIRKDYTITADMTPEMIQLRTLQIGGGYTVTVAAGAKVKVGPLILGKNARIVVEPGSQMYYNGPTTQVTGTVQNYATAGMDLTAGNGSLPSGASWDSGSKTLTLSGTVVDLSEGPVLKLPAGSTIRLSGATSRLSAGSQGPVIQCLGDLTITGGTLEISGGTVGIEAAGHLRLTDAKLEVRGATEASLSAASITGTNSDLTIYGSGVAARATQGGISFDSLSEEEYHTAAQGRYTLLVEADGTPATTLYVPEGGAAPDTVTVQEQVNPDGTTTRVETDTVTGVVNKSTTGTDGTVTVEQTRPDGVSSTVTASPDGTVSAQVTLPEGVEEAVVALKVPDATATTVAQLVKEDGTTEVLPLCDLVDGAVCVRLEESAQLLFSDGKVEFSDAPAGAWYEGAVDYVSSRGLFLGVGENQFDPLGTTTCAMMVTVLHRLAGAPEAELPEADPPFGSLDPEAYYAQAVAWALENGIVDGTADGFVPDKDITREQLAEMLYRTAGTLGLDREEKSPLSGFTDADEASQFAQAGLRWAVAEGILQGRGDGTLDPAGTATRSEVAAMIQRFVNLLLQNG